MTEYQTHSALVAQLDRTASELQDTCHKQAQRIAVLEQAARQALEALLAATPVKAKDPRMQADAIVALREALEAAPPPAAVDQEPVALGPLAKRRVFDYIRGAYDLGYNDARNARAVPGDNAPGYKGRDVEVDHGGALFNALRACITAPQPARQPLTDKQIQDIWCSAKIEGNQHGPFWFARAIERAVLEKFNG